MPTRKAIPDEVQKAVLTKSRRRCCLCYGLDRKNEVVAGQLAHLDGDNQNSSEDNLAWLCLRHHDQYDSRTSQSKGILESEVRHWRDLLYKEHSPPAAPMVRLSMAVRKHLTRGFVDCVAIIFMNHSDRSVFIKNFYLELNDNTLAIPRQDAFTGAFQAKRKVEPGDEFAFHISADDVREIGRPATDYVCAGVSDAVSGSYVTDTKSIQDHIAELLKDRE